MSHYETLGVTKNATQSEIKKAYRKLANKYHPDKKEGDEIKFKDINAAYDIIGDENRRQQYDMNPNFDQGFQGNQGFNRDFGRQYNFRSAEEMYAFMRNQREAAMTKNQDTLVVLEVTLKDAYLGKDQTFEVDWVKDSIRFTLTPGTRPGAKYRLSGKGKVHRTDLPAGDLIVQVQLTRVGDWDLVGADLYLPIHINPIEAMIGCTKEFEHLSGKKYKVPVGAGTGHGEKLRLAGLGMPIPNNKHADMYAVIVIDSIKITDEEDVKSLQEISNKLTS